MTYRNLQICIIVFYLIQNCVPFFFMLSGYLFYRNINKDNIKIKMKSRIKTLLVPYLIWNIVYAIFMISLNKLGYIKNIYIEESFFGILKQIINADFSPLWFVKYLVIFSLVAPISYKLFKSYKLGLFTIVFLIIINFISYKLGLICNPINVNANSLVMLNYQYIYYSVGIWSGIHISKYIISHTFRLLFVCCLWFAVDLLPIKNIKGNYSFFIYCVHLIPLQCIQGVTGIIFNKKGLGYLYINLVEYILLPIIIVMLIIGTAELIKKYIPGLAEYIYGGRL